MSEIGRKKTINKTMHSDWLMTETLIQHTLKMPLKA